MFAMNAQEIRRSYLEFCRANGHKIIPRAKLVPENDETTLFTGSGMQPLLPYLLGENHEKGLRLADSQTCFRADDIDEVGDNRHTTFFEMLGNWSLGDYFKAEQLPWFFEFLTEKVGLDPKRLYVTCFIGDQKFDLPKDIESAEIWKKLFAEKGIDALEIEIGSESDGAEKGMRGGRIFYYDGSKNWWSRGGGPETTPVGDPCGPDSEVFYEFTDIEHDLAFGENCHPNCDCGRYMEIGNSVFMAYRKTETGFEELEKKNVDFGGGLERIAAAAIDSPDMFKISLLWPIIEKLEKLSGKNYADFAPNMRVIADHIRAAIFLVTDGVEPSNKEQGYVVRRLLRRAIRYGFELGIEQNFMETVAPAVANLYTSDFPEIEQNLDRIVAVLVKEEKAFRQTLRKGLKEFEKLFSIKHEPVTYANTTLTLPDSVGVQNHGLALFKLYDTYGFPLELSTEEAAKRGIELQDGWQKEFNRYMAEQKVRSQTAAKGTFKGGLGGETLQHKKYHTATHLLQSALRQIFGEQLRQHGSNITEERLRFDFNLDRKMTPDEIAKAEELVNQWIVENHPVKFTIYPTEKALEMGAIGPFGERYGETVKVYQIGVDDNIASLEICGGPHVEQTGQLGEGGKKFKITKEEASSAGIRRIKAALV